MPSIGDLIVNLQLESRQFSTESLRARGLTHQLAESMDDLGRRSFRTATNMAGLERQYRSGSISAAKYVQSIRLLNQQIGRGGFIASGGRAQMVMIQLAFAAEDAASQWGTQGFAGAMRAASNNLTFVAATLGGARGAMAAVAAVIVLQVLPPILKATGFIEDLQKKLESLQLMMKNVRGEAQKNRDIGLIGLEKEQAFRQLRKTDTIEGAENIRESALDRVKRSELEITALNEEQTRLAAEKIRLAREQQRIFQEGRHATLFSQEGRQFTQRMLENDKRQGALSERMDEINRERTRLKEQKAADEDIARQAEFRKRSIKKDEERQAFFDRQREMNAQRAERMRQIAEQKRRESISTGKQFLKGGAENKNTIGQRPDTAAVGGALQGSREAFDTIFRAQAKAKEAPKESTQQEQLKTLKNMDRSLKNGKNLKVDVGAFKN